MREFQGRESHGWSRKGSCVPLVLRCEACATETVRFFFDQTILDYYCDSFNLKMAIMGPLYRASVYNLA